MTQKRNKKLLIKEAPVITPKKSQQQAVRMQMYKGPIPPASELANYDKINPGLAERIVKMAENEQLHRHNQEAKKLNMDSIELNAIIREASLGQLFAFVIALFTVGAGAYTAIQGAQISGSILGTAGLASIVYIFIKGRQ